MRASSVFTYIGALGTHQPNGALRLKVFTGVSPADLCEGNKIISLKKILSPQPVGDQSKRKKIRGPWVGPTCPCSVPIGYDGPDASGEYAIHLCNLRSLLRDLPSAQVRFWAKIFGGLAPPQFPPFFPLPSPSLPFPFTLPPLRSRPP